MHPDLKKRIKKMAITYIISKKATIRSVAKIYNIGASTLHQYFTNDLKEISPKLYEKVKKKKAANTYKTRQNFVKPKKVRMYQRILNALHKVR